MYTRYAEFLSSEEATVKTAREFWKELDRKEMEKGSLVGVTLLVVGVTLLVVGVTLLVVGVTLLVVGVTLLVVGVVDMQLTFLVLCS